MELIGFVLILGVALILLKCLGWVFRAGIFLISIPLQILLAIIVAVIAIALLPAALVTGALFIIAPLGLLVAFFPVILIGIGIYLLARK